MSDDEWLKEKILHEMENLVLGLLYYDRKNDEELTTKQIEDAFRRKAVTVDEVVKEFEDKLLEYIWEGA